MPDLVLGRYCNWIWSFGYPLSVLCILDCLRFLRKYMRNDVAHVGYREISITGIPSHILATVKLYPSSFIVERPSLKFISSCDVIVVIACRCFVSLHVFYLFFVFYLCFTLFLSSRNWQFEELAEVEMWKFEMLTLVPVQQYCGFLFLLNCLKVNWWFLHIWFCPFPHVSGYQ